MSTSRWPIQRTPFRPLSRSERVTRLIAESIAQVDLGGDALSGLQLSFNLQIPDDVLGMPDSDADLAAAVLLQLSQMCAIAADGGAGAAVLA